MRHLNREEGKFAEEDGAYYNAATLDEAMNRVGVSGLTSENFEAVTKAAADIYKT